MPSSVGRVPIISMRRRRILIIIIIIRKIIIIKRIPVTAILESSRLFID